MIIQLLGAISLAEYVEAESAEGTEGVRKPENCARCGARDCFWKHGPLPENGNRRQSGAENICHSLNLQKLWSDCVASAIVHGPIQAVLSRCN